jgi:hypothetical protein
MGPKWGLDADDFTQQQDDAKYAEQDTDAERDTSDFEPDHDGEENEQHQFYGGSTW